MKNKGEDIIYDEYTVWADMDRKLKESDIHVAILCSPHNPCGRVWERWELEKAMEVSVWFFGQHLKFRIYPGQESGTELHINPEE